MYPKSYKVFGEICRDNGRSDIKYSIFYRGKK